MDLEGIEIVLATFAFGFYYSMSALLRHSGRQIKRDLELGVQTCVYD